MQSKMKRIAKWGALLLACGLSISGESKELTKVTVMQPITAYDVRYAPWAVAKTNGYFADEGLDIDMPLMKGSMIVIQQLVNGAGRYGVLPPDGVILADSKGADLKFYYSFITKNPFPLAVTENSPVKTLQDLKGKKIGVYGMSAVQFYTTQAILKSVGYVKDKDYTLIDVGSGASAMVALQRGDVDALAEDVLIYAGFENRGAKFRFLNSPQIDKVFSWGLVTTAENLKSNPEQAIAIARALSKGRVACAANPRRCIEDYFKVYPNAKPTGIDSETAIKEQEAILMVYLAYGPKPSDGKWGSYSEDAWHAAMDYMVGAGLIAAPVPLNKMYTTELLPAINQFDEASIAKYAAIPHK